MKLYGMTDSGNCYKPRLLLAKLGLAFEHVETSSLDGSTRSAGYLAKNPNGKVPLLELDDGRLLAESNAILIYLADSTRFFASNRYHRALICQWLFFEQYSHEPYVAVRRSILRYPGRASEASPERMQALLDNGDRALAIMETRLHETPFLAGDTLTIADIALYAYTHVAPEGGYDLARYPAISAWLSRVASDPGHVPLEWTGASAS